MSPGHGASTEPGAEKRNEWIGVFLASAVLFSELAHDRLYLAKREWLQSAAIQLNVLTIAAAFLVLVAPTRPRFLALLCFTYLPRAFAVLPELSNHRWMLVFISAATLLYLVGHLKQVSRPDLAELRPFALSLLSILYTFAGFAKLNSDFLLAPHGCARVFLGRVQTVVPIVPNVLHTVVPFGTTLIELALPPLLLLPKTRRFGLRLAFGFHVALAFNVENHLVDFSSLVLALLGLIVLGENGDDGDHLRWRPRRLAGVLAALFVAHIVTGMVLHGSTDPRALFFLHKGLAWIAFFMLAFFVQRLLWPPSNAKGRVSPPFGLSPAYATLLSFAFFNGVCPYLGLKTRSGFQMYSNLDLEADRSNHWFIPRSADLLGILSDHLKLESGPPLSPFSTIHYGETIPYFELERLLVAHPEETFVIHRKGAESAPVKLSDIGTPRYGALARKLLLFQPLGDSAKVRCIW